MTPNRRGWMENGLHRAALISACLGLLLGASAGAQDTVAKPSDEPAAVHEQDTSACACNPCARVFKAVVPTAEVHLTQTLSDPDRHVFDSGWQLFQISEADDWLEPYPVVGNPADSNTIVDMTVGVHSFLGRASMLSVGGVFPLGDGWDRTFDSELAVKFNHSF